MKKERRKFDKEFKIMTVELCLSGKPTSEVAEELGLRTELVGRWKREYQQKKEGHRGATVSLDTESFH